MRLLKVAWLTIKEYSDALAIALSGDDLDKLISVQTDELEKEAKELVKVKKEMEDTIKQAEALDDTKTVKACKQVLDDINKDIEFLETEVQNTNTKFKHAKSRLKLVEAKKVVQDRKSEILKRRRGIKSRRYTTLDALDSKIAKKERAIDIDSDVSDIMTSSPSE